MTELPSDDLTPTTPTRHVDLSAQLLTLGELATAAGILGHSGVLGLEDWFAGRSEADIRRLAEAAAHSLQARGLLERLPDPGHDAVPENAPHAREEGVLLAVARHVRPGEIENEGLRHRQPSGCFCHKNLSGYAWGSMP